MEPLRDTEPYADLWQSWRYHHDVQVDDIHTLAIAILSILDLRSTFSTLPSLCADGWHGHFCRRDATTSKASKVKLQAQAKLQPRYSTLLWPSM